jgi:MoaA/NifB/PqqE/SkfB family radical SAM enzyme
MKGDAIRRWLTLTTHRVRSLPIAILMPHSSCDCRCVMCDIWKGAGSPRQLTEQDVAGLLASLRRLRTRWVVLSGGEPLLHPGLFRLCDILRDAGVTRITMLSTGQQLAASASAAASAVDEVILSVDGAEATHDEIRRVPGAFRRIGEGVAALQAASRRVTVTGRCVIQRRNFAEWSEIVAAARRLGLAGISFLAADLTSQAFNRRLAWGERRRAEVAPSAEQMPDLEAAYERLLDQRADDFESGFIAEPPDKLARIVDYYAAHHGLGSFPTVRCTAPWVSAVVEADGTVRPCFFHRPYGDLADSDLDGLVNHSEAIRFRRRLDVASDPICRRCVCSLDLRPGDPL